MVFDGLPEELDETALTLIYGAEDWNPPAQDSDSGEAEPDDITPGPGRHGLDAGKPGRTMAKPGAGLNSAAQP